jgi:pyruvate/2-oxoacid:ferredoxin oxidoreductase alpha subunit
MPRRRWQNIFAVLRSSFLKIGVKFCGGCHIAYERMDVYGRIKDELKDLAQFVSYDDEEADLILVIMGCPSACVDTESFDQHKARVIKSPAEAEAFISEVREFREDN